MALLPEVHVNLGQVTFERIYQIFLPLIPGGTLVGGLLLTHPEFASHTTSILGLGRYSRMGFAIFTVYIVGLALYGVSVSVAGTFTWIAALTIGKRIGMLRDNLALSQRPVWRKLAAGFLGNGLVPSLPTSPATLAQAGQANVSQILANIQQQYDYEWQDCYNLLQDYVLRGSPVLPNEILFLWTYLQALGWALLYLYLRTPLRGHWSVALVSASLIFFGATFAYGANFLYWKYDRLTYWDFSARLINEIRTLEAEKRALPQTPPSAGKT